MPITKETIEAAKAEHGEAYRLAACGEEVIVRRPTSGEFERYMALAFDDERKHKAPGQLFRDVVVYPDRDAVNAMLARLPGLALTFGQDVAKLAGATRDTEVGKL